MPAGTCVNLELDGGRASVELDRPDRLNALSRQLLEDLDRALDRAEAAGARVLTVRGAGRAFCAGADVAELGDSPEEAAGWLELGHRVFDRLEALDLPTVAVLNGHALGGGLELALCCDLVVAAAGAKLGLPEPTLGLIPGLGGTQRLPRALGRHRAMHLLLTGEVVTAEAAHASGLLSLPPVAPDALDVTVDALVERLLSVSSTSLAAIKQSVRFGAGRPAGEALRNELHLAAAAVGSADGREGVAAFLARRTPVFEGHGP